MEAEKNEIVEAVVAAEHTAIRASKVHLKRFHKAVRMNKKASIVVATFVVVLLLGYLTWGVFVAATVDGSVISRWSIIQDLEKNSGEQALDTLVTKKLIDMAALKAGVSVNATDIEEEVAKITKQVEAQGGTLAMALEQQGMTESDFRDQIVLQKKLEKILGDKVSVTDEEVATYLTQSKMPTPTGATDEDFKNQVREQLKGQKFNTEASDWVMNAKAEAKIKYFVDYAPKPPVLKDIAPAEAMSSQPQE